MEFEEYAARRRQVQMALDMAPKDQSKKHSTLVDHPPKRVQARDGMMYRVYIYEGDQTWKCQIESGQHEVLLHESEFTIVEGCSCQKCWERERAKLKQSLPY